MDNRAVILVDDPNWVWRDMPFCHMASDTSLEELHAFARWLGVPERAFGGDHYDIPDHVRSTAIDEGALPVSSLALVEALYRSGQRRRPGERISRDGR